SGKVAGLAGGLKDTGDGDDKAPEAKGAVHSADIEYAMGTLPTNRVFDWQPEDFLMSDIFSGYYANFIKTGNPNGLGLPDWTPANGQEAVPVLRLDINTTMTTDRQTEERYKLIDTMMWGTKK
ncbi:MAG: carboxylesterase family protein, partial [Xylanibacter rarus]